jgi:hypothetical protein
MKRGSRLATLLALSALPPLGLKTRIERVFVDGKPVYEKEG